LNRISRKQDRLLGPSAGPADRRSRRPPGTADSFAALIGEEFALLVKFRRSAERVPAPVWFGLHDGYLCVESLADASKVKATGT
jgi:hypothetical protein